MTTLNFRALALSGALIAAALPAASIAAPATATDGNFVAQFTSVYGSQYPYEGTLQLHIGADGIITGYYRPSDNFDFVPVHGGRDGDRIWMDIGSGHGTHVDARLEGGKMTGTAVDSSDTQLNFSASQQGNR